MADNFQTNPGSGGASFRARQDTAGTYWPIGLTAWGPKDSETIVSSSSGEGLPVQPSSGATWSVTGTFWQATQPISVASLPLPSGASTEATLALLNGKVTACNTGAVTVFAALPAGNNNIGDVDVASVPSDPFGANADAASATGSISAKLRFIAGTGIPITGTAAVTQSGTWTVQPGNTANTTAWLVTGTSGTFPVTDSGGSLTVDAPVGTPVFVRLSDGSAAISTLPVSYATTGSGTSTGALRVELPTNGTGVIATVGAVTAITNALPAGTNAIGKLAANSGIDIGDVDVTSVSGNVTVVQSTASSLNATVVGTGTFVVQATLAAETTKVIGTVNVAASQTIGIAAGSAVIGHVIVDSGTVSTLTGGGVASGGVDSGNPIKTGCRAVATLSTATLVSAANRVDSIADLDGATLVRQNSALGDVVSGNATNTDGTSTSCIASSGAGVKTYITDCTICNTSAVAVTVDLKDGSTVKWSFPVPAGGGVTHNFSTPLAGTAATAWNFDPSAAATTITCSLSGFKSKI